MELLPRWLPRPSPWDTSVDSYARNMRQRLKDVLDDTWSPKSYPYAVNNAKLGREHRERAEERVVRRIAKDLREVCQKYDKQPELAKRAVERVLHFCFDRNLKSERKLVNSISQFMRSSTGRRNPNARRAFNTVTAACIGPPGHLTLNEFNTVLDIGRKRRLFDLSASMRREWDSGKSPTFENPDARYQFRKHHSKNIELCEKWYTTFESVTVNSL